MAQHFTSETFEQAIAGDKPVLVDFWAAWCGPCRAVAPVIDAIAAENTQCKVCKINVDEQPELAQAYGVMSIPTLAVVKNGKVVSRSVGVQSTEQILQMLQGQIST